MATLELQQQNEEVMEKRIEELEKIRHDLKEEN
jgi:hypothetical protein